jgi:histidinol phosphatase-like PHP family hydrolase
MISRRGFLGSTAAAGALSILPRRVLGVRGDATPGGELDFPLVDFHSHIEGNFTVEEAVRLAAKRGVKLGIVEHGGFGEVIGNDSDLKRHIQRLSALPVYKGIQAEGHNWMSCFSKEVVCQLDYVLADALTFPEKDGRRVQLWTPEAKIDDKQDFMERYVDFNVQVISKEPIDIFANPTFLPEALANEYDTLWTKERMRKVIDAALKYEVAIEINSRFNIPSWAFVKMAKDMGVKFSFGSNNRNADVGKLDYSAKIAKECGLTRQDMFMPQPPDKKPILRRTWRA